MGYTYQDFILADAYSMCTDGVYIWVTNPATLGTVVKLRAADGAYIKPDGTAGTLEEASIAVGDQPVAIAIDGTNTYVWVINKWSHDVNKILASDGTIVATYPTGNSVYASGPSLEYDGTYFWAVGSISSGVTGLIRIEEATGVVTTFTAGITGNATDITYDGTNGCLWVTDYDQYSPYDQNYLRKISLDGSLLASYSANIYQSPRPVSVTTNGEYVWVANQSATPAYQGILKYRCSDGAYADAYGGTSAVITDGFYALYVETFPIACVGNRLCGATWSGHIWTWEILPAGVMGVYEYYTLPDGQQPTAIMGVGTDIWQALYGANRVGKLSVFYDDFSTLAQTVTFPTYDINVYGRSLDKIIGLQFEPYGPTESTVQNVTITYINNEQNIDGAQPFILSEYQDISIIGTNFDRVYGLQFEPYGPISEPPTAIPSGPLEPSYDMTAGNDYDLIDTGEIWFGPEWLTWYLDQGDLQRDTWYKVVLHCNDLTAPSDPTLVPTGPLVPSTPLVPPQFELLSAQHIGVPTSVTDQLLADGILQYNTWYKADLTYECGGPVPSARAINPDKGWNWDPAYVIMPNIQRAQYIEEFKTLDTLESWLVYGDVSTSIDGLVLQAGPQRNDASSVAEAIDYPCGDWTIDFHIKRQVSSDTTPAVVSYIGLNYYLPESDPECDAWIERVYQPDIGHAYVATIIDGPNTYSGTVATNAWNGSLRIIRYKNSITLLAKDWGQTTWQTVVYARSIPSGGSGTISIYTANNDVEQKTRVVVEKFIQNPGIMFGSEPAVYTEICPSNINLLVQPQIIDTTRFVTIASYAPSGTIKETENGFEYIRPNRFSLGGTPSTQWWIYRDVPTAPGIEQMYVAPTAGTQLLNITLTPKFGQYPIGQVVQYKVIAKFNDNTTRDVTSQCVWSTNDLNATLTQTGLMYYSIIPTLSCTVTATYQGLSQSAIAYTFATSRFASYTIFGYEAIARAASTVFLDATYNESIACGTDLTVSVAEPIAHLSELNPAPKLAHIADFRNEVAVRMACAAEPNASRQIAQLSTLNPSTPPGTFSGSLAPGPYTLTGERGSPSNYWRVTSATGGTFVITLRPPSSPNYPDTPDNPDGIDTFLYLWDNTHTTILASDDDGGGSLTSLITYTFAPGVSYIVECTSYGGGEWDYTMRISMDVTGADTDVTGVELTSV